MSIYRFETTATMKPHNNKKWWIDADIVRPVKIEAADLKTALQLWRDKVQERDYIQISNNALKSRNPMSISPERRSLTRAIIPVIPHNTLICG